MRALERETQWIEGGKVGTAEDDNVKGMGENSGTGRGEGRRAFVSESGGGETPVEAVLRGTSTKACLNQELIASGPCIWSCGTATEWSVGPGRQVSPFVTAA